MPFPELHLASPKFICYLGTVNAGLLDYFSNRL